MISINILNLFYLGLFVVGVTSSDQVEACPEIFARKDVESMYVDIETPFSTLRTFELTDDALNYAQQLHLSNQDVNNMTLFVNETLTQIENISFFPLNSTNGLNKRWTCSNAPLGTHFTQRQTAQDGWWWTPWKKSSSCYYSRNSPDGGQVSVDWTTNEKWVIQSNFDFKFAYGMANSHFGIEISKQVSKGGLFVCRLRNAEKVSIWSQTQMYWSDQQTQRCVRRHYGKTGCHCGAWSEYIHGDVPVKNREPNLGCSANEHSGC